MKKSGGGHGGRGGYGPYELATSFSYGSALNPTTWGSGGKGDGGRGGGFLSFQIYSKLRVEGTIESDGESKQSGGAGGSILINTYHLDGDGTIQANGGTGSGGGGGAGGRIAVYYTNQSSFIGTSQALGGSGKSDLGGAGTVFIQNSSLPQEPYRILKVINRSPNRKLKPQIARPLSMAGLTVPSCTTTSLRYPNDVQVSTTATPYCTKHWHNPLWNIFSKGANYLALTGSATITIQFPFVLHVNSVKVYPATSWLYETAFKVSSFMSNVQMTSASDWIETFGAYNSLAEVINIGKNIDKVS